MNSFYSFIRPLVFILSILLATVLNSYAGIKDISGSLNVISILRNTPLNEYTNSSTVNFSVTFDTSVVNLDESDFTLTVTGISGAAITNISGSGANYTVTVNTGSGNGSIRLDINSGSDISPSLINLPFTSGEIYTIDKTANAPVFLGINTDTGLRNDDNITKDPTIGFFGTAEAYSTLTITNALWGIIGTCTATSTGNWNFDFTTVLPNGNHTFTATITDIAGNVSSSTSNFIVTIDAIAPPTPIITKITNDIGINETDYITNDQTLTISGTAEANSTVIITRMGTGVIGSVTTSGSGSWDFDYSNTVLPEGNYTFTASAFDAAGNISSPCPNTVVTIDITPPSVPSFTGITNDQGLSSSDLITNDQTIGIYGSAGILNWITISETTLGIIGTIQSDGIGNWFFDYGSTTLPSGVYSFSATAMDTAGNTTSAGTNLNVTIDAILPKPAISTTSTNPTPNTLTEIQFEFSEDITDFSISDIIVNGGTVSNFNGSGSIYTADITPSGNDPFTIDIFSNATVDIAGNWNSGTTSYQIVHGPCTSPSITTSPSNQLVCEGESANFSIQASGTNISYQWMVDEGFGFIIINDGGIYGGTDTKNLNILSATPAMNTYTYKCNVTGTCTPCAISASALLTVNPKPVVNFSLEGNNTLCSSSPEITLPQGFPAGGIYSGNGINGQNFDPSQSGNGDHTIAYTYIDGNGCSNNGSDVLSVTTCTGIFTNRPTYKSAISIYPNPTYDLLTISSEEDNLKIEVYNSVGKVLINTELTSVQTNFSLKDLPSGMYIISIWENNELIKEEKVVKY